MNKDNDIVHNNKNNKNNDSNLFCNNILDYNLLDNCVLVALKPLSAIQNVRVACSSQISGQSERSMENAALSSR